MNYFKIVSSSGDIDLMDFLVKGIDDFPYVSKRLVDENECVVSTEGTPTGIKGLTTEVTVMTKDDFDEAIKNG